MRSAPSEPRCELARASSAPLWSVVLGGLLASACAVVEPLPVPERVDAAADATALGPQHGVDASLVGGTADMTVVTPACGLRDVRINELSTGGANGATDEYVELYNPCTQAVALAGASIAYRAATSGGDNFTIVVFGATHSVAAHGRFLVANGNYAGTADVKPFQAGAGLAASGGGLGLKDAAGAVIDSLGWGSAVNAYVEGHPVAAPSTAQAAARKTDGLDTDDNMADFALSAPSPGAAN